MSEEPVFDEKFFTRLANSYVIVNDCWQWKGYVNPSGHAQMRHKGKKTGAHRLSYESLVGPIPAGLVLDHLCRNPSCINPSHLEPVKQGENVRRAVDNPVAKIMNADNKCGRGHPFNSENTYIRPKISGGITPRECRRCRNDAIKRFQQRKLLNRKEEIIL